MEDPGRDHLVARAAMRTNVAREFVPCSFDLRSQIIDEFICFGERFYYVALGDTVFR